MKKLILFLSFLFLVMACSTMQQTKAPDNKVVKGNEISEELKPLKKAEFYCQLAKNAEQIGDTLGAEYYFSQAMNLSGAYQQEHTQPLDSAAQELIENISLKYTKYLARINGIEHDTLSAANVMKVLAELEDSLATKSSDSSVVTIPDVIEEENKITIPLVLNQKVENAMKYFQGRGRRVFTKWLQRTGRYKHMIIPILREEGVPDELFYLAMIESGFNPYARSYARAVGMWQFVYATGRAYGLNQSWWYDERRDPVKSTRAAAQHLKDLYQRFNNWYIAIAGYNYSPGKIAHRIERYEVDEFWELPRLPRQTRNYVPTFIAVSHMAKDPEKYGFFIEKEDPVKFDTVTVHECVDLNVVAECVGSTFQKVKKLNPALLRWCTPPDRDSWVLNIPEGTRDEFLKNYAKVPDEDKLTWIHHKIRSGQTLSTIARRYGVSMREIKRFNNIRGTLIRAGHYLVIPVPQNREYASRMAKRTTRRRSVTRRKPVSNVPGRVKQEYVVKKGETLWEIANRYNVSVSQLRKWNGLGYSRIIHPGQKVNVWLPENSSLLASGEKIPGPIGNQLNSQPDANENQGDENRETLTHIVRFGDNLWDIASRYNVSIREIKKWNNMRSNLIKPGEKLKILVTR